MGKRKATKAPPPKKKRPKVETKFNCPFCNNEKCVSVKMDMEDGVGRLQCTECQASFSSTIHKLSAPIDVYCKWLEECSRQKAGGGEEEEGREAEEAQEAEAGGE